MPTPQEVGSGSMGHLSNSGRHWDLRFRVFLKGGLCKGLDWEVL